MVNEALKSHTFSYIGIYYIQFFFAYEIILIQNQFHSTVIDDADS